VTVGTSVRVELHAAAVLAALLMLHLAAAPSAGGRHVVCVCVFLSKDCPGCEPIEKANTEKLARRLGCEIRTRYFSVDDVEQYGKLVRLEQQFGDEGNEIPVAFFGKHVLGGKEEIERSFATLVEGYARDGGAESFPEPQPSSQPAPAQRAPGRPDTPKPVYIAYFDSPGCKECRRVEYMLQSISQEFPAVRPRKFVTSDRRSQLVQEAISHRFGVPVEKRLLTPAIFVGSRAFIQDEITDRHVRACLDKLAATGPKCPWEGELDLAAAEHRLFGRMRSLSLGAVVAGGLIDGINPCAFATLILFISFMQSAKRHRSKLLTIGVSFIAAVFLSYFAVGVGLSELVLLIEKLPYLDGIVTWCVVLLCVVLAALSLRDAVIARRGAHRAITLQLPRSVKDKIKRVLIRFGRTRYLVLGGLLIGALISMLELVCTGQIYFPLIKFMVSSGGGDRTRAIALLLVYNACFVAPLLAILGASYLGASSERLTAILKHNLAATKVAIGLFFAALATLMVVHRYYW
jgi:hypothetical protein